jgi:hypothetical protein
MARLKTLLTPTARRCLDFIAPSHADLFMLDELREMSQREEADSRIDVSFLHRSYCIAGLPTREPKVPTAVYAKSDGRFALTVHPTTISLPSGNLCDVGVPWGAKARLLILWASSEINEHGRTPGDPWLEIGAINEFLDKVGIPKGGKSVAATKEQLIRLAFSSFTMILKDEDDKSLFTNNRLFTAGAFHDEDLEHYREGNHNSVRWPLALKLSPEALRQFTSNAIPIPAERLGTVSNNPTAIDLLVYLCYRLPMLGPNSTELVNWRALNTQFGSQQTIAKFREAFAPAIRAVRAAYPEASFDTTPEGLVLRYSDPAVLRRAYIAVSKPGKERKRRKVRNRYDSTGTAKPSEQIEQKKEQIVMDI